MAQTWVNPASGRITSVPGYRSSASTNGVGSTNHQGYDIAAPSGTPIYAATGGTVTYAGTRGGYGNFIEVTQEDGSKQKYGHLSSIDVQKGDTVGTGDQIGGMGSTGHSTGSHLHYENRDANGRLIDPTGDGNLNDQYKKGGKVTGGEKGDGTGGANDKKKGEGDGDPSKKDEHDKRDKEKKPLDPSKKKDIKGSPGNYQKTETSSITSRMPTHEPWSGHPKSTEGPRQALRGDNGSNSGGGGGGSGSSGTGSGGGTSTGGSGSARDDGRATNPNGNQQQIGEQVYNRLISKGYTPAAANAAVGNFMGEGLNGGGGYGTKIVNDPSGTGKPGSSRGIGQWRNERGTALENFAAGKYEGGWRNIDAQVDFFDMELKRDYKGLYNKMQTSDDGASINRDLVYQYERPAERLRESTTAQRIANARGFDKKRQSKKPPVADPGMNSKNGAPSPAGGSSGSGSGGGTAATPSA